MWVLLLALLCAAGLNVGEKRNFKKFKKFKNLHWTALQKHDYREMNNVKQHNFRVSHKRSNTVDRLSTQIDATSKKQLLGGISQALENSNLSIENHVHSQSIKSRVQSPLFQTLQHANRSIDNRVHSQAEKSKTHHNQKETHSRSLLSNALKNANISIENSVHSYSAKRRHLHKKHALHLMNTALKDANDAERRGLLANALKNANISVENSVHSYSAKRRNLHKKHALDLMGNTLKTDIETERRGLLANALKNANISVENSVHSYSARKRHLHKKHALANLADALKNANISIENSVHSYSAKKRTQRERKHIDVSAHKRDEEPFDTSGVQLKGKSAMEVAAEIENNDKNFIPMLSSTSTNGLRKDTEDALDGGKRSDNNDHKHEEPEEKPEYIISDKGDAFNDYNPENVGNNSKDDHEKVEHFEKEEKNSDVDSHHNENIEEKSHDSYHEKEIGREEHKENSEERNDEVSSRFHDTPPADIQNLENHGGVQSYSSPSHDHDSAPDEEVHGHNLHEGLEHLDHHETSSKEEKLSNQDYNDHEPFVKNHDEPNYDHEEEQHREEEQHHERSNDDEPHHERYNDEEQHHERSNEEEHHHERPSYEDDHHERFHDDDGHHEQHNSERERGHEDEGSHQGAHYMNDDRERESSLDHMMHDKERGSHHHDDEDQYGEEQNQHHEKIRGEGERDKEEYNKKDETYSPKHSKNIDHQDDLSSNYISNHIKSFEGGRHNDNISPIKSLEGSRHELSDDEYKAYNNVRDPACNDKRHGICNDRGGTSKHNTQVDIHKLLTKDEKIMEFQRNPFDPHDNIPLNRPIEEDPHQHSTILPPPVPQSVLQIGVDPTANLRLKDLHGLNNLQQHDGNTVEIMDHNNLPQQKGAKSQISDEKKPFEQLDEHSDLIPSSFLASSFSQQNPIQDLSHESPQLQHELPFHQTAVDSVIKEQPSTSLLNNLPGDPRLRHSPDEIMSFHNSPRELPFSRLSHDADAGEHFDGAKQKMENILADLQEGNELKEGNKKWTEARDFEQARLKQDHDKEMLQADHTLEQESSALTKQNNLMATQEASRRSSNTLESGQVFEFGDRDYASYLHQHLSEYLKQAAYDYKVMGLEPDFGIENQIARRRKLEDDAQVVLNETEILKQLRDNSSDITILDSSNNTSNASVSNNVNNSNTNTTLQNKNNLNVLTITNNTNFTNNTNSSNNTKSPTAKTAVRKHLIPEKTKLKHLIIQTAESLATDLGKRDFVVKTNNKLDNKLTTTNIFLGERHTRAR